MQNNWSHSHWMPFTSARAFRKEPMMLVGAKGMNYIDSDGRSVLDGMAGLWCVNLGHSPQRIVEAIQRTATELDFVSSFKMSHPAAFTLADRLAKIAPGALNHVFFTNSGSEAVDTALKIARGYHAASGNALRTKFIGRAKSYHGVGFGGLSVGGLGRQKRGFGPLLPDVAHIGLPYDHTTMAFSRGEPQTGAELADQLEQQLLIEDAATVAAVIVEPVTGSGGVYPPPKGYLKRLREICDRHGILLIFDEVITGFGRLGTPFASDFFGVQPDLITCAKGLTNGAVPMGAVLASDKIYDTFMQGPEETIELMHGYTYSAHPLACAAAHATLDVIDEIDLYSHVTQISKYWEASIHELRSEPHVRDIRSIGIIGCIELEPRPGEVGARGNNCAQLCFEDGVLIRGSGDSLILSPPLVLNEAHIDKIVRSIVTALRSLQ